MKHVLCFVTLLFLTTPALAQQVEEQALAAARFQQRIGETVPLTLQLQDETGQPVQLATLMQDKPAILAMVWYSCHDLCPLTLNTLSQRLADSAFQPGQDFSILVLSINPADSPASAAHTRAALGVGDGWHLLTGTQSAIRQLADAIGFHYTQLPDSQRFSHPAGLTLVSPGGRISRYLPGLDYRTRDLDLALTQAGQGALGSPLDQFVLRCFHFDPSKGRYSLAILQLVNGAALLVAVLLAGAVGWLWWRQRRRPES